MMMFRYYLALFFSLGSVKAFVQLHPPGGGGGGGIGTTISNAIILSLSKSNKGSSSDDSNTVLVQQQQAFPVGTFVEFVEKKRVHVGKIDSVEYKKSSGGARYHVVDSEGKKFDVPDKCVLYSMPCPNSPGQATQLYDEFCKAQNTPVVSLQETLQVTPELLEMAWEETVADEEADEVEAQPGNAKDHLLLTPDSFIELVHAHVATSMEKYMAWKLLQTETAHIFFREIKDHGRVVAFKAKTRKAVVAAKEVFCRSHQDNELCYV